MAKRIYVFFISLLLFTGAALMAQDTVMVPLHIRAGFDAGGLAGTFINKDHISYGVYGSTDINEVLSLSATARYSSFSSSEFTYDYSSQGLSFTLGPDFNLLKPKTSEGRHSVGVGLHYGISFYSHEAPRIEYTNPWGTASTSFPLSNHTGHFFEVTPGVRTEIFPWLTIGWNISLRLLLSDGTNDNLRPVHMPGFGNAASRTSAGASYFISISIPYRTKRVITKPRTESEDEEEEENEDTEDTEDTYNTGGTVRSNNSLR